MPGENDVEIRTVSGGELFSKGKDKCALGRAEYRYPALRPMVCIDLIELADAVDRVLDSRTRGGGRRHSCCEQSQGRK